MSDDRDKPHSAIGGWVLGLALALVIYLLAPGPLIYMVKRGTISETGSAFTFIRAVYDPWFDLVERVKPLKRSYEHYFKFWDSL
jgi:hypothetical protein